MATINSFEQIQKIPGLESKVDGDRLVTKEPTGFTNNANIVVSYDSANRTVTLTGTFTAYYRGEVVAVLISGWVSPAHSASVGTYFLRYNGTTFIWDPLSTVVFDDLLICYVVVTATTTIALREVHGLMPHDSHKHAHETVGTYVRAGGDLSAFTLNSETATNRRPQVSATTVVDEDLDSVLSALSTNAYGWLYLSGANTANVTVDNTEIVATSGTAYWNEFTGGNWVQTLLTNNQYAKIFVLAIPTANDATSIKKRYLFVQPQSANTSLSTIQALGPTTVNFGDIAGLIPEFAFIAEIIIRRQGSGNNWRLIEVNKLTGTKYLQNASPAGAYLSSVATDGTTITGNGTPSSPLAATFTNPMTTAEDLIIGGVAGAPARLAKGVDGKVLKMASGAISWGDEVGFANPMDSVGDMIVGGTAGAPAKLAIGAIGRFLRSTGTNQEWSDKIYSASDGKISINSDPSLAESILNLLGNVTLFGAFPIHYIKSFANNSGDTAAINFSKSRSDTIGTLTQTQDGDRLTNLAFGGVNSSGAYSYNAAIRCYQDGSAGATYIPTRLEFYTGPNSGSLALGLMLDANSKATFASRIFINTTEGGFPTSTAELNVLADGDVTPSAFFHASSATFASQILRFDCNRTANSAWSYIVARSGNNTDTEFNLRGDGNGLCDGAWTGGGADYAEYFEWADGNLMNEDRRGYSVSLVGDKIKIASEGDTIIGVISGNPSAVGDSAWNHWSGKYLRDDFGSYLKDDQGNRILNPNFSEEKEYVPRESRPEWSMVGLVGKLRVRNGQQIPTNWIKLKDISADVSEYLVR